MLIRNCKKKLFIIFFFVCLFFSNLSICQNKISHEIFINVGGLLMNNLDIQYYGEQLLNSKVTLAPLIELGYYQRLYKSWGIKIGAGKS